MARATHEERPRSVAIVAVHGVADHLPRTTARAVGDLLHRTGNGAEYAAFTERTLRIALRPAEPGRVAPAHSPTTSVGQTLFRIDERASHLREGAPAPQDVSDAFMCAQLAQYRSPLDSYETVRLETTCRKTGARVHVHEVYWADLSRASTGGLRVFGEVFQILLHLPTLGRKAVEYARIANLDQPAWKRYALLHRLTERVLTLGVPLLGMMLLWVGLTLFAIAVPAPGRMAAFSALAGAIAGTLLTTLAYRASRDDGAWRVWCGPVAGAAVGLIFAFTLDKGGETGLALLVSEWTAVASGIVVYALIRYERLRPGALLLGSVLQALTAVAAIRAAWTATDDATMAADIVGIADRLWAALDATTYVFVGLMMASTVAGGVALSRLRKKQVEYEKCAGAWWTAALSVALPGALLGMLAILAWTVLVFATFTALPVDPTAPLASVRCHPYASSWGSATYIADRFTPSGRGPEVWQALTDAVGPLCPTAPTARNVAAAARVMPMALVGATFLLPPAAVLLLLLSLPAVVLPAVFADQALRPDATPAPRETARLGGWLDGGYQLLVGLGSGITLAFGLYLAIGLVRLVWRDDAYQWTRDLDRWAIAITSTAAAAFLGAMAGREWLPGLRTVTGILLDVDGYLREHPRDATPRARIAERFVSLLRHISRGDDDGRAYDAVIVVAHSQGTVIAADLLRFLQHHPDPVLAERPWTALHLVTMGCPLRQLYASCFPHLYHWVRDPKGTPDPVTLDLASWTNLYRSGDYIGRYLWNEGDPWSLTPKTLPLRVDRCLGPGAHTRYWDSAGTDVAAELDRLIRSV